MAKTEAGAGAQVPDRIVKPAPKAAKSTQRSRPKAKQHDERGRETREQEGRNELFDRVDENQPYVKPANLEAPPPRPGMRQRWIRVGLGGQLDEKNLSRKRRGGWRARPANTVPKGYYMPKMTTGRLAGCIVVEGMLLCEIPETLARKRDMAIAAETRLKTNAVNENLMRVNEGAGGGFGPIRKGERSKQVREVAPTPSEEDVDLTSP
ncbi:MAG TPA: hypothetical protein VEC14_12685 [Reyranellaceae bacterium]|nr:hypothetical protein [Reyranellaceae bacterium]